MPREPSHADKASKSCKPLVRVLSPGDVGWSCFFEVILLDRSPANPVAAADCAVSLRDAKETPREYAKVTAR